MWLLALSIKATATQISDIVTVFCAREFHSIRRSSVVTNWSDWSACSVTCGPGTRSRSRTCEQGTDGVACPTTLTETEDCIDFLCSSTTGVFVVFALSVY